MTKSIIYHTQGVKGFEVLRWSWGEQATAVLKRQKNAFRCATCRSSHVTATPVDWRTVQGLPLGRLAFYMQIRMHRLYCHKCGAFRMEQLPFLSTYRKHITRRFEQSLVELREHMSIKAVARYYNVDWKTVKNAEKDKLRSKYQHVPLGQVRIIGIDEIYVGHRRFKTIVRDLETGHVLHVGDGKGSDALKHFWQRLRRSQANIEAVAMDMSSGYAAWVREKLPHAEIVFDHFHVIKLMNDKVDNVRRRTLNAMEENERKTLKKSATCY